MGTTTDNYQRKKKLSKSQMKRTASSVKDG